MVGSGDLTGPSPVGRDKPGSKTHVVCDRRRLPPTVLVSGANTHDVQLLIPLLNSVAPIRCPLGQPRHRPAKPHANEAYDQPSLRAVVCRRGIAVRIARNGGPQLWEQLMDELRELHLGVPRRDPDQPPASDQLRQAYHDLASREQHCVETAPAREA